MGEHRHVLRGVVRQPADQAAQFWGRGHHEDHRLVSFDVFDVVGDSLKVPVGDGSDGPFKGGRTGQHGETSSVGEITVRLVRTYQGRPLRDGFSAG